MIRRHSTTKTEIQAPSNAAECSRVRKIVCLLASNALHSPNAVADLELAVGEAFSNAVKYGDSNTKVQVSVESRRSSELAVEMAYKSQRFDTSVGYPANPASGEGGFGRFIIQQVTDSMEYTFSNGHTRIRMTKGR